jgi:hypothetical protein
MSRFHPKRRFDSQGFTLHTPRSAIRIPHLPYPSQPSVKEQLKFMFRNSAYPLGWDKCCPTPIFLKFL